MTRIKGRREREIVVTKSAFGPWIFGPSSRLCPLLTLLWGLEKNEREAGKSISIILPREREGEREREREDAPFFSSVIQH